MAVEAGNPDHAPIAEPDAAIVIEDSKRRAQGNVLTNDRDPEGKASSCCRPKQPARRIRHADLAGQWHLRLCARRCVD
ncbi:MAG: hypothetical protein IPG34_10795 [Rhodocyclaceae bacterium]|nr:hypothetical protein [Rhodocyclaceae bacterium]